MRRRLPAKCRKPAERNVDFFIDEYTLLSEKTYERIRYGRIADRPRPETVMQVCVGLGLPLPDAEGLFNAVGYHLGGCALHEAYRALLAQGGLTVYGCDAALRSLGLPPLARWAEG